MTQNRILSAQEDSKINNTSARQWSDLKNYEVKAGKAKIEIITSSGSE